uniref:Uncharacterized protein n=1 Tax=Arundo donax TaxID=35708 RepID=A0A0A8ZAT6_ARUDO
MAVVRFKIAFWFRFRPLNLDK